MTAGMWFAYAILLSLAVFFHLRHRRRVEVHAATKLSQSVAAGMTEPPSLHPEVNREVCVGSRTCVNACPEQALGIVGGKAQLVNAAACIGHGACAASCPVEAITLVFGTARRGMDIPYVKPTFETNVPGIYIAGELGGMGLVRKAAEQGRQAVDSISRERARKGDDLLDLIIVGAGPAGLSATLAAMEKKLRFLTLEQEDSLGGTVYHYPRNKVVMTQPVVLPMVGTATLGEISKESLLAFWQDIVARFGIKITFGARVDKVSLEAAGSYLVKTSRGEYRARSILLAIGRRGTPRKIGAPGEELPKVVYRLIDPEQYRGQRVLVVGGGDSAIEAALALAREPGTSVTLSYRGDAFSRIKQKNRENVTAAQQNGLLTVLLGSNVTSIEPECVHLERGGDAIRIENDALLVCAGGVLPTPMLKDAGIQVETKFGTE
jgi:thioredoxin reductase/Pyruvate/2-oxoacid:ferredoxin oxidoreductase delta subunit